MSVETNKQTVRDFFTAMGEGRFDDALAKMAPDAIWWVPTDQPGGMTIPVDVMRGSIASFFNIFTKHPRFEFGRMTAEGDRVCFEQTSRDGLTHGGVGYANDYHMLVEFRNGLISEVREYMNPLLSAPVMSEIHQVQAGK